MKRLPFRLISFAEGTLNRVEWVRRWLFNLVAGVSLILLMGTGGLWVYNLQHGVGVYYIGQDTSATFIASRNVMSFRFFDDVNVPAPMALGWSASTGRHKDERQATALWSELELVDHALAKLGIAYRQGATGGLPRGRHFPSRWKYGNRTVHSVYAPHWLIALLCTLVPLMWLIAMLRARRRHVKGLCPNCGYDLRATPERCPECGAVPEGSGPLKVTSTFKGELRGRNSSIAYLVG